MPSAVTNSRYSILDVLRLVRRNALVREQPVEVARARAIVAELDGRRRDGGEDAGLEIVLQREHDIELAAGERAPHVGKRAPAARPIEADDLVDRWMPVHERRRPGLQHPRDVRERDRPA